ncbi:unnamed protein product [Cuscuta campestris]|uniref:Neprosin PEP catalytic domain-containing protein n=1 Tax=Cuscuta campestris TaxID=132261 RepID=A0A484MU78_9ASTE|nr:unnamed protein product [Cuscuta campestris]
MVISEELERRKAAAAAVQRNAVISHAAANYSSGGLKRSPAELLWLNKRGCPIGTVPIRRRHRHHHHSLEDDDVKTNTESHLDFAGVIVGKAPSGQFTGAKATMTIWNPILRGDNQYSSAALYLDNIGDNIHIRAGWIVHPTLYGDSRTRLFSRWTREDGDYGTTGCYNNHCPGFVVFSNKIPLDYPFPNMSQFEGDQFDTTIDVFQSASGDWVLSVDEETLGIWTAPIFSSMTSAATQLRFGGECFKPEGQDTSPEMGSGRFSNGQYDKTCYMRRVSYYDSIYGSNVVSDDMVQLHDSRCYYEGSQGYNFEDDWYGYSFMFGGAGKEDEVRCLGD